MNLNVLSTLDFIILIAIKVLGLISIIILMIGLFFFVLFIISELEKAKSKN